MLRMVVAMLVIFGLLLAFHDVVSNGKQQAELRHKATALRAVAVWHCNGVPAMAARDRCLLQIASPDRTRGVAVDLAGKSVATDTLGIAVHRSASIAGDTR